ncbi:MAG: hypothetical protein ACKKMR_02460 [Candidatus Nealsonbacteria bacterium]
MERKRLPKSLRKYVRREKARIRREVWDLKEQEKLIEQLYQKIFKRYIIKKNSNISEKK